MKPCCRQGLSFQHHFDLAVWYLSTDRQQCCLPWSLMMQVSRQTKLRKFEAKVGQKTGQLSTAENPCCWKPCSKLLSPTQRLLPLPLVVNGRQSTHQKIICHASYDLIKRVFTLGAQGVIYEIRVQRHPRSLGLCTLWSIWPHTGTLCGTSVRSLWRPIGLHKVQRSLGQCTLWSIWPQTCYIALPCPFAICWATNYVTTDLV